MAKNANQKQKLLYIAAYLTRESDETHPVMMADILAMLAEHGIESERKSVYDDLNALRSFGMDIVAVSGGRGGYYLAGREFEVAELKLLADAVASSKFITEKKTIELIGKLTTLTSSHRGQELKRQLYVIGRAKNVNEKIYYCVDTLHRAIHARVKIRFLYFHYNASKAKVYTNGGELRTVSPYALCWDDENYYLVAYNPVRDKIVHFRVDRMEQVLLTEEKIDPMPEDFLLGDYIGKQFGMFAGEEKEVTMRFDNSLAEVVMDQFGKGVFMIPSGEGHFVMTAPVNIGPPFYGWVFQFGSRAEILGPEDVRMVYRNMLSDMLSRYEES